MEKPEVRIVQDQQIENKPTEVSGWEAEQLLRKYGYQEQSFSTRNTPEQAAPQSNLTFEEMIAQEEAKKRQEEERKRQMARGPKPTTFDGRNGYDSEIKYSSDEDSGFGFKVQIVSDMPLPKY